METFYDILKITLPAVLVMITAWLVIRHMLAGDDHRLAGNKTHAAG